MSAKNALKGYCYQVNVLNAFVQKMDLKRNMKKIEAEAEVKHHFDDMIIIDENDETICFQVKNYEKFDINKVQIKEDVVKIVAGNTRSDSKFNSEYINGLIVNKDIECDSEILGFESKVIEGIHVIPITMNNYDEQVGEYINIARKEHMQTQVINKISNSHFELTAEELPKLSLFSNDLKHETIKFNKIPEIVDKLSWHLGAPGTGKSHLVKEIEDSDENSIVYRFYADKHEQKRLVFENFLEDFTQRLFETPEKKTFEEIVSRVVEEELLILIDGFDHVYNYQRSDLDKFLEFFDLLKDTKTLIFSRPFPNIIDKENVFNIITWDKEDTFKYLEQYGFDDDINEKIYDLTNGYPIITYYLSEHYKLNKDLTQYDEQINSIEEYYQNILDTADLQYPLELFLFCNSYILESEIKYLLDQNSSKILIEFIEKYPYFFTKELNRIRLFHDSLFTYLRNKSEMNYDYSIDKVKESILSKKINFLSRFNTFDFDDDFIKEVLKLYCSFDTFEEISHNFDFESVKIFYLNLRKILKDYPDTLNIYQYYSFILIYMIVDRDDYFSNFSLFYQIFRYANWKGYDESDIYSNGVMWSLYQYYKEDNLYSFEKLLETKYYDEERLIDELNREWDIENLFYEEDCKIADENIIEEIIRCEFNYKLLEDYLAYIWINKYEHSKYYSFIDNFVNKSWNWSDEMEFNKILDELKIRTITAQNIMNSAKLRIYQCGHLEDENIYSKFTLSEYIANNLNKMSCYLYSELLGYLRFNNTLKIDFDYTEIFKYFNMYSFHKDYSVETMDTALLIFEKHECIHEDDSINLILNTMNKSEKGIRHLSLDYLSEKTSDKIESLLDTYDLDFDSQIGYLDEDKINKFPEKIVFKNFFKFNSGREIDFNNVKNILKSKYKNKLLQHLKSLKLNVYNVPNECLEFFEENNILYEEYKDDYIIYDNPDETILERGYLKREDFDEIKFEGITHLDLAKLQNGNHDCLTYPNLFKIYDDDIIKEDLLLIIHNSITTNVYFSDRFFANMYYCLGNIPYLIDYYNVEIDWNKLFNIFKRFIEESSIPL